MPLLLERADHLVRPAFRQSHVIRLAGRGVDARFLPELFVGTCHSGRGAAEAQDKTHSNGSEARQNSAAPLGGDADTGGRWVVEDGRPAPCRLPSKPFTAPLCDRSAVAGRHLGRGNPNRVLGRDVSSALRRGRPGKTRVSSDPAAVLPSIVGIPLNHAEWLRQARNRARPEMPAVLGHVEISVASWTE